MMLHVKKGSQQIKNSPVTHTQDSIKFNQLFPLGNHPSCSRQDDNDDSDDDDDVNANAAKNHSCTM